MNNNYIHEVEQFCKEMSRFQPGVYVEFEEVLAWREQGLTTYGVLMHDNELRIMCYMREGETIPEDKVFNGCRFGGIIKYPIVPSYNSRGCQIVLEDVHVIERLENRNPETSATLIYIESERDNIVPEDMA